MNSKNERIKPFSIESHSCHESIHFLSPRMDIDDANQSPKIAEPQFRRMNSIRGRHDLRDSLSPLPKQKQDVGLHKNSTITFNNKSFNADNIAFNLGRQSQIQTLKGSSKDFVLAAFN